MSTPNNIFFNEFYDEPALPRWNFDVAFIFHDANSNYESSESTYAKNITYSELLSKAVTNIKLPEMKIEKLVTYLPGFHFAFPGKPGLNGEISIKFNDDLSLTIRKIADYLLQYNYNPRYQQHDSFDSGTDNYLSIAHTVVKDTAKNFVIAPKFDIYIRIYNVYNEFIQKVIYKNCFVKSIGNIELDYAGEDIVSTSITVSYPYFKVLNPDEIDNQYDGLINHEGGAPNRNDTKLGDNPYGDIMETPDNSNNVEQNDKPITEKKQPILEDEISKNEQSTPAKLSQTEDTKKEDGKIENPNTPAVADNQDTSELNKPGVSEVIDTNNEEQSIIAAKSKQIKEQVATSKPIDGIASTPNELINK